MATLSKEQLNELEEKIDKGTQAVNFKADGYLVAPRLERLHNKLIVAVYINGFISGKDAFFGKLSTKAKMTDIARRFHCLHKKHISKKAAQLNIEIYGKRTVSANKLNEPYISTTPWFSSAKKFLAHLQANNQDIEVLDIDTYNALLAAQKDNESTTETPQ